MSEPHTPPSKPHWTAGAVALLVIGLLILIPSGLCTAVMGGMTVISLFMEPSNTSGEDVMGFLTEAIFVGGPFIVAGAALVYAGFRARKRK